MHARWRTPSGTEVDFVWNRGNVSVAIEVKATDRWRGEYGRGLAELDEARRLRRRIAVYLGDRKLRDERTDVLPLPLFLDELAGGRVVG